MQQTMLKGKCALVTGSTSGIGWGIAQALAKSGAVIMLHGSEDIRAVSSKIDVIESLADGKTPHYSNLDVSEESSCKRLIEKATSYLGKIDILVNNVGAQFPSLIEYFPSEEWDRLIKVNLSAPFFLSRAVLPEMYSRQWGRLIHIGSPHSLVGSPNKSAYVASKHALLGLSKVIALEAAGSGVTSNTICPGYALTPYFQKQIEEYAKLRNTTTTFATMQFLEEKHPSGEFVTPGQIGGFVNYLCSDAAKQVTGGAFPMDGGWTAC